MVASLKHVLFSILVTKQIHRIHIGTWLSERSTFAYFTDESICMSWDCWRHVRNVNVIFCHKNHICKHKFRHKSLTNLHALQKYSNEKKSLSNQRQLSTNHKNHISNQTIFRSKMHLTKQTEVKRSIKNDYEINTNKCNEINMHVYVNVDQIISIFAELFFSQEYDPFFLPSASLTLSL